MNIVKRIITPILSFIFFSSFASSLYADVSSFSDDFNRTSLGSNWSSASASFGVDGQILWHNCCTSQGRLIYNPVLQSGDYNIAIDTYFTDAMAARGLLARYQNLSNYYYAKVGRDGDARIMRMANGVSTQLGFYDGPWFTPGTWHNFRFEVRGTELKLYVDGTLKVTVQDNALASGKVGIGSDSYYNRFDNFSLTVLSAAPTVAPPAVDPVPEFVASAQLTVSGTKEANTSIWINGSEAVPLNSSTSWSAVITLPQEGVNQISIVAKNSTDVQSNSVNLSTKLDLSPPVLVITSPINGSTVSADGFRVTGTAVDQVSGIEDVRVSITVERRSGCERENVVTVNNALANFDPATGAWFFDVLSTHISPGRQAFIAVTSRDKLLHSTTKSIQVIVGQFEPITGSISIANGAAYTKSAAVTLQFTRSTNVVQMSLSQNNSTFPPPEDFSDTKLWTLTGADGVKTIFVKFFNANGRSSQIYSDKIILDTTLPNVILTSSTMTNQVLYALTYTVDGTQGQENITLTDGENVIDRTFSDPAGNETQVSWRVTLDRTIPVITGPSEISFTPNGDLNQDTAQITGQVNKSADWKIEILDSSQTVLKSFQGTGTSFDVIWDGINPLDNRPYPDGVYTAKVTAKDTALNEANPLSITISLSTSQEIERIFIYAGDKRIAMEENGEKFFILSDHLGSSIVHLDHSGNEVSHTEYKSFGGIKTETSTKTFNKKFTGKELDDSTGLYDYEARQYDAEIGRFITADPLMWDDASLKKVDGKGLQEFLADPQNLNRYSYVLNNPLKYIDLDGLKSYLVSRNLEENNPFLAHTFVVSQAKYLGDPNAIIYSFGPGEDGNLSRMTLLSKGYGPLHFGKDTYAHDVAAWAALTGKTKSKDISVIKARDSRVDRIANSIAPGQDYAATVGVFCSSCGVNSNSASHAIANNAAGKKVPTPGGLRPATGAGNWQSVKFINSRATKTGNGFIKQATYRAYKKRGK